MTAKAQNKTPANQQFVEGRFIDTLKISEGFGMLVVEAIAKIRRAYFVQQKPIKRNPAR